MGKKKSWDNPQGLMR